jgi:hypothetical protein
LVGGLGETVSDRPKRRWMMGDAEMACENGDVLRARRGLVQAGPLGEDPVERGVDRRGGDRKRAFVVFERQIQGLDVLVGV